MTLPKNAWYTSVFKSFACLASLAIAGTCVAQEQKSARAERAAKLDSKVSELRAEFKTLREKLVDASDQARSNLRAELNGASRELQAAADSEQFKASAATDLEQARQSWSASYHELRKAYRQHVAHLQGELSSRQSNDVRPNWKRQSKNCKRGS